MSLPVASLMPSSLARDSMSKPSAWPRLVPPFRKFPTAKMMPGRGQKNAGNSWEFMGNHGNSWEFMVSRDPKNEDLKTLMGMFIDDVFPIGFQLSNFSMTGGVAIAITNMSEKTENL